MTENNEDGYVKHLASKKPVKDLASGAFPVSDFGSKAQKKELAEVLEYYWKTNTYQVKTRGAPGNPAQPPGKVIVVPRKVENPNVVAPLDKGTVVILDWDLGFAFIDGVLNVGSSVALVEGGSRPISKLSKSGGNQLDNSTDNAAYYRFPGMPDDAIPGDFAAVSPDGSYIAALQGKEATIYGSDKARVSAFGTTGLVQTICEELEQYSGLGVFKIKNDGGRYNLSFRAAADQLTESGGSEEQWTFHLDIGNDGDFFDMRVTKPDGSTLSRLYLSSDGRVEIMGLNGVNVINAGKSPRQEEDGGDVLKRILGTLTEIVTGEIIQRTTSKRTSEISEDDRTVVGHNHTTSVNNHQVLSVGGNQQITITGGDAIKANPLNVAVMMKVLNGSYVLDIGNEIDTASPAAMAGYNVFIHNGEITLGQDPSPMAIPAKQAFVSLNSLLPNSIALGGTANPTTSNPALFHACLFEPYAALMSTMIALLDSHIHPTAWGPSGPASAPSPGGFASSLSSMVTPIQSIRVAIGA